jgi:hypothetical protein
MTRAGLHLRADGAHDASRAKARLILPALGCNGMKKYCKFHKQVQFLARFPKTIPLRTLSLRLNDIFPLAFRKFWEQSPSGRPA